MQGIQAKSNQTCFRFEQLKLLLYLISHYEQVFILNKPQGKIKSKSSPFVISFERGFHIRLLMVYNIHESM